VELQLMLLNLASTALSVGGVQRTTTFFLHKSEGFWNGVFDE
jgi:hypothetical protein